MPHNIQVGVAASEMPCIHNEALTASETDTLLQAIANHPAEGLVLDVATVILNTGLRTGELTRLRVADVDLAGGKLIVSPSKSFGSRDVPFNEAVAKVLARRIAAERNSEFVFGSAAESRISRAVRVMREISSRVLGRCVKVQTLRHTFATRLLCAGIDITVLAHICGWHCSSLSLKQLFVITPEIAQCAYDSTVIGAQCD